MLDGRFVFVLRCLYRQGKGQVKVPENQIKLEFWEKIKKTKDSKIKIVNTPVNTKIF